MALLMLERRSVDKAAAPPAWCEEHNARLRVLEVLPATIVYECPPGRERYVDRIEQVHVIEERWMREEDQTMDERTDKPDTGNSADAPDAGASQSPTSDGKPLPGDKPVETKDRKPE